MMSSHSGPTYLVFRASTSGTTWFVCTVSLSWTVLTLLQQLRPSIIPRLRTLHHLTVHYTHVTTRADAAHLYKWIRRVITHSPLASLRLACEIEVYGPAPTFDPLLQHLSARHAVTLRRLDAKHCYVGHAALREFCRHCTALEELSVGVSEETLVSLIVLISSVLALTRSLSNRMHFPNTLPTSHSCILWNSESATKSVQRPRL